MKDSTSHTDGDILVSDGVRPNSEAPVKEAMSYEGMKEQAIGSLVLPPTAPIVRHVTGGDNCSPFVSLDCPAKQRGDGDVPGSSSCDYATVVPHTPPFARLGGGLRRMGKMMMS